MASEEYAPGEEPDAADAWLREIMERAVDALAHDDDDGMSVEESIALLKARHPKK